MSASVRILLVEDDLPTRQRLRTALLQAAEFSVRDVGTLAEAHSAIADAIPDVLITDLNLPDGHGTALIRAVHGASPATEILVISVLSDERTVVSAITAGASGYVLKDALPDDITETVRQVLRGHSPLSAAIARYILRHLHQEPAGPETPASKPAGNQINLTQRETDILWGIAKGLTYNEIADSLGIAHSTVPNYIKSIYRKLEVNSRGEAVFEAINRRLINL